mmetsp:Transcript_28432/g.88171  ORF Transcript_28432/g.88171 Transcript_28432/m.88171 type:complete len:590 (+) Transcript_28432:934-2703(+)
MGTATGRPTRGSSPRGPAAAGRLAWSYHDSPRRRDGGELSVRAGPAPVSGQLSAAVLNAPAGVGPRRRGVSRTAQPRGVGPRRRGASRHDGATVTKRARWRWSRYAIGARRFVRAARFSVSEPQSQACTSAGTRAGAKRSPQPRRGRDAPALNAPRAPHRIKCARQIRVERRDATALRRRRSAARRRRHSATTHRSAFRDGAARRSGDRRAPLRAGVVRALLFGPRARRERTVAPQRNVGRRQGGHHDARGRRRARPFSRLDRLRRRLEGREPEVLPQAAEAPDVVPEPTGSELGAQRGVPLGRRAVGRRRRPRSQEPPQAAHGRVPPRVRIARGHRERLPEERQRVVPGGPARPRGRDARAHGPPPRLRGAAAAVRPGLRVRRALLARASRRRLLPVRARERHLRAVREGPLRRPPGPGRAGPRRDGALGAVRAARRSRLPAPDARPEFLLRGRHDQPGGREFVSRALPDPRRRRRDRGPRRVLRRRRVFPAGGPREFDGRGRPPVRGPPGGRRPRRRGEGRRPLLRAPERAAYRRRARPVRARSRRGRALVVIRVHARGAARRVSRDPRRHIDVFLLSLPVPCRKPR